MKFVRRLAFLSLLMACGSRTGLFSDIDSFNSIPDDGGPGGSGQGFADSGRDANDGAIPPIDARPPVDVFRSDCPDANSLLVYTIADDNSLQAFNPDTGQFRFISRIACPVDDPNDSPFSMAVDRRGTAYVLFQSGNLFRVSTLTGACVATSFSPDQFNFHLFGMGFATNAGGPDETLYIAGDADQRPQGGLFSGGFASIDTSTFVLSPIGEFAPTIDRAELTGTGDGRLYAFYTDSGQDSNNSPSNIGEIGALGGPTPGKVIGQRHFPNVEQGTGWAFAFWSGDFYMFHAPNNQTTVTRWRPSDDSVTDVANTTLKIVGAGVSTCSPQQ